MIELMKKKRNSHFLKNNPKKMELFFDRKRTPNKAGFVAVLRKVSSEFYHNSNSLFHLTKIVIFELCNILLFKSIYCDRLTYPGNIQTLCF